MLAALSLERELFKKFICEVVVWNSEYIVCWQQVLYLVMVPRPEPLGTIDMLHLLYAVIPTWVLRPALSSKGVREADMCS